VLPSLFHHSHDAHHLLVPDNEISIPTLVHDHEGLNPIGIQDRMHPGTSISLFLKKTVTSDICLQHKNQL